jgi:hypothetical protein
MLFAEKELRKRHALKERVSKVVVSMVPLGGDALSEGAGAFAEAARDRRDWIAALSLLGK